MRGSLSLVWHFTLFALEISITVTFCAILVLLHSRDKPAVSGGGNWTTTA